MKHGWRPPAFSRDKTSDRSGRNSWLKFVCDSHLELLMALVDQQRNGQPLSREDGFHYIAIKEQAEAIMAQAEAENWTEEECRVNVIDSWWGKDHATP